MIKVKINSNGIMKMNNQLTKIALPVLLSITIIIAGLFAFMPVQQATTVHTTLATNAGTQTNLDDQERMLIINLATGVTFQNDTLLVLAADGAGFSGTIMGLIVDETQGAGLADLDFECHNLGGGVTVASVSGDDNSDDTGTLQNVANDMDDAGDQEVDSITSCELLTADLAPNTEAIVSIHIDNWPEI